MNCQVYFLVDPTLDVVFYVGIGKPGRSGTHVPKVRNDMKRGVQSWKSPRHERIAKLLLEGHTPQVVIAHSGVSKDEAKQLETQYIAQFGRLDLGTGCLTNRTRGGEWINDCPRTPEWRARQSAASLVSQNRPATKALKSQALKGRKRTAAQVENIRAGQLLIRDEVSRKRTGAGNPAAKPCMIDGKYYPSMKDAALALDIEPHKIYRHPGLQKL